MISREKYLNIGKCKEPHECVLQTVEDFFEIYFVKRDFKKILNYLDNTVTWIGTDVNEICRNREEVVKLLALQKEQNHHGFIILNQWHQVEKIVEDTYNVFGELNVKEDSKNLMRVNIRFSLVCKYSYNKVTISHIHISIANEEQDEIKITPRKLPLTSTEILGKNISKRIEELERTNKEFRKSEAVYRIALEVTNDVVYEIDLPTEVLSVNGNKFRKLIGFFPLRYSKDNFKKLINFIHYDDVDTYINTFSKDNIERHMNIGVDSFSLEYRIKHKNHEYIWIHETLIPIKNEAGTPIKFIGHIKNIHENKKKEFEIKLLSQSDSLTNLLDKSHTEIEIREYIENPKGNNKGALFIIDIDNFKIINDTLGHMFGDEVLKNVSKRIKNLFLPSDIVGRVGGDEFMIFLKEINSYEAALEKAAELNHIYKKSYLHKGISYSISLSIGIAFYPIHGNTFAELYEKADLALYNAKRHGRDCFRIYDRDFIN